MRPLDPYSSQRLNNIRANFLKTEQGISEVNSQLDAQLEKKYEEKRQAGRLADDVNLFDVLFMSLLMAV